MLKFCVALFTCGIKFQSSTQVCILNNTSYWLLPNPCLTSPLLWEHPYPRNFLSGSAEGCVWERERERVTQSCLTLATPWTVAHQASLSMEFSRKNTGVGCHSFCQGELPDPGIKPTSPILQVDSLPSEPPRKPLLWREPQVRQRVKARNNDRTATVSCIMSRLLQAWSYFILSTAIGYKGLSYRG